MLDYLIVGEIINTHGVKGELKILPHTDDTTRFKKDVVLRVSLKGNIIEYKVVESRPFKQFVLVILEGIDTMDKAVALKGATLEVLRKDAIKLSEDHFFISDLLGCSVVETDGTNLGKIRDVFQTGSNDVYEVYDAQNKMILIPALKSVVKNVDLENKLITVELLPGLKEIYYED